MAKEQTDVKTKEKLKLTITTPRGIKFEEKADMVVMRCVDGDLGILPGHESISTVLGDGILKIMNDDLVRKLAIFGGVVEVKDNDINIFTTIAQLPGDIDLERAKEDREKAESAMREQEDEAQFKRLQVMLRRSMVRIEVNLHLEDTTYFDIEEDEEDESD